VKISLQSIYKGLYLSSEKERENRSFCFSGVNRPRAAQRKVNPGVVNRTFGNRTHQSSLGPGSAVGEKLKAPGQIGKISVSEASRAAALGRVEVFDTAVI